MPSLLDIYLLILPFIVAVGMMVVSKRKIRALKTKAAGTDVELEELRKRVQIKEYQLNEAQRIGSVGSFIWNLKDNIIVLSEELYRLYGKDPRTEKLTPDTFFDLIFQDDKETVKKRLSDAVHETEPFEYTYRVAYPDKSIHWLKTRGRTMQSDTHTPLQIIGSVQDVTEVQEREEHLQAKTAELTQKVEELEQARTTMSKLLKELNAERAKDGAILSSIGDGVIATDETGKIIFINPMAESLLGVRLIDVIGKQCDEAFVELDEKGYPIPKEERSIKKTLESGQLFNTTNYSYQKSDKKTFPVAISIAPILFNGKTIGAIDVFRDITHEKDVDRMKTEFISLASHQLRTPLSAMKWLLQILLAGDVGTLTQEQSDIVKDINESNERMIALVNSLLNVSRIESGRIIIDPEPTDLRKLVKEVEADIRAKLDEKKHTFTFNAPDDLPTVNVDPRLIRQVYMNLLTNAIKYTPQGGTITVTITKTDTEFVSQISDSGYGIPEKDKDKVFGKFYRGENILKVETDGNGLGLYLVKAIVESSNGKIWYESEERKGTTFWFSLPAGGSLAKKGEVVIT